LCRLFWQKWRLFFFAFIDKVLGIERSKRRITTLPMAQAAASTFTALGQPLKRSNLIKRAPCLPSSRVSPRRVTTSTTKQQQTVVAAATRRQRHVTMAASNELDALDADDSGDPELPDYDVVTLGPLEASAIALGVAGWKGGSDDANAYVLAVDRGYVLIGGLALFTHIRYFASQTTYNS
jgi:hypothetical protein